MRPLLLALALLSVAALAEAQCPTIQSGPPVDVPLHVLYGGGAQLTIWRDGTHVTALITPLVGPVAVEGTLSQVGVTQPAFFVGGYTLVGFDASGPVCARSGIAQPVTEPVAVHIDDVSIPPRVDLTQTFTLNVSGALVLVPEEQRGVELVVDGCHTCSAGQVAAFHAQVEHPGPVNLVAGVVFPDGTKSGWFSVDGIGAGTVPLPQITVPAAAPNGFYTLQVSLLDPALGTTIARGVARVEKK
jgi:hypothetical protein